jgi:hypothetical protein
MQKDSISIRELQKMNAGAIQALKWPTRITSGSVTVGLLSPVREFQPKSQAEIEAAFKQMDERWATLPEADKAALAGVRTKLGLPDDA